jgi:hypothetical protein
MDTTTTSGLAPEEMTYAQLRFVLANNPMNPAARLALQHMLAANPTGRGFYDVTVAQQAAWNISDREITFTPLKVCEILQYQGGENIQFLMQNGIVDLWNTSGINIDAMSVPTAMATTETIVLAGNAYDTTVTDQVSKLTVFDEGYNQGLVLRDFAGHPGAMLDLVGQGFVTTTQAMAALRSDGRGGMYLVSSNGATADFQNATRIGLAGHVEVTS